MTRLFFSTILAILLCATSHAQTLKSLMFNTNGAVVYSSTNTLTFTNNVQFSGGISGNNLSVLSAYQLSDDNGDVLRYVFDNPNGQKWELANPAEFRSALGLNGRLLLVDFDAETTNTVLQYTTNWTVFNNTNFRAAIGLSPADSVQFDEVFSQSFEALGSEGWGRFNSEGFEFSSPALLLQAKSSLGLGPTSAVVFGQTTVSNATLFVTKTNVGPFEGLANMMSSNNTTLSNETLFRVGVAEQTNRSAQFGFRVARTNNGGEGFATFSVYGYNALMMIGPSDRSRTNTNAGAAIEADLWTVSPTNRVMTLRDTNTGALTLHQELGFSTGGITTNAPANTTNVALWLRVWVGTNNYRLPLYQ